MELRHLRSFVVLSEELHFGRAATRIPLAQPALSQQIKQLERELGARLFDRGPGGGRLTPAGETFLVHARTTLASAARALRAVREQADGVEGSLTVGVFAHAAEPRTWTDFWRLTPHRGGLTPREVGPDDVSTVNELLTAIALRGCVTTTAASLARFYPSRAVRYVPVDDLDGCMAVLGTYHPDDPLVATFGAVALRVSADLSGLLHASRPLERT